MEEALGCGFGFGGETGPAIVPGNSGKSLFIQAIRHEDKELEMPKAGAKLDEMSRKASVLGAFNGEPAGGGGGGDDDVDEE